MRRIPRYARLCLMPSDRGGYVLIIVLLVLAVSTAVVMDFSGSVYAYVNASNNFAESERLSLLLRSSYRLAAEKTRDIMQRVNYNDRKEISLEEKMDDAVIGLHIEDNNSRFNINSLVFKNGLLNETAYRIFRRLLRELDLAEDYADRIADYIDPDRVPRTPDGEVIAKNRQLHSLSELGYIFPQDAVIKMTPYVTVFGDGKINMNTADRIVLKSLHPGITGALADRITETRKSRPFERLGDVLKVPGMERTGLEISDMISVAAGSFNVQISTEANDLRETAEAGFELGSGRIITRFWRER